MKHSYIVTHKSYSLVLMIFYMILRSLFIDIFMLQCNVMRKESLFERNEVFIVAAAIAAQATSGSEGFRQKDVKFLVELFLNWIEHAYEFKKLTIQNTQISRYLMHLTKEGFARRLSRGRLPSYRLTRAGLIELINRMVSKPYFESPERFLFINYFLRSYRERIMELVKAEGSMFPPLMEFELKELLDEKKLKSRQIKFCEDEIKRLDIRINEALKTGELAVKLRKQGFAESDVIATVQKRYPYELNSQKPLSDLFAELPAEIRTWELEYGSINRATLMFLPIKGLIIQYLKVLREV